MRKSSQKLRVRCAAAALAAAMLLTACAGGAASFDKQMELGRKYLSETNYAEAIAAFTRGYPAEPERHRGLHRPCTGVCCVEEVR